jgi:hypothetical protein
MNKRTAKILIGDLLVKAGMIELGDLADAIPISTKTGLPVGRILVGSGFLSDEKLQSALRAQSLIRDNFLTVDMATKALQSVATENISLDDALANNGWRSEYFDLTNKLGHLLRDSELVHPDTIDEALQTCFTTGLPLGRILVLKGVISDSIANAAVSSQILIRDKKIDREQAVAALKFAAERRTSIEESLDFHGFLQQKSAKTVRLGELLVLAGIVSDIDLLSSVEKGLVDDIPIGQVLVEARLITQATLDQALQMQALVNSFEITPTQGAEVVKLLRLQDIPVSQALAQVKKEEKAEIKAPTLEFPELIRLVGIVPGKEMVIARALSHSTNTPLPQVLLSKKLIDQPTLTAVLRTQELLAQNKMSAEQAIFALHNWLWTRGDFDELLKNLGWL